MKVLGKLFNRDLYTELSGKELKDDPISQMDWYLLSSSTQGMVNNTMITSIMTFSRV